MSEDRRTAQPQRFRVTSPASRRGGGGGRLVLLVLVGLVLIAAVLGLGTVILDQRSQVDDLEATQVELQATIAVLSGQLEAAQTLSAEVSALAAVPEDMTESTPDDMTGEPAVEPLPATDTPSPEVPAATLASTTTPSPVPLPSDTPLPPPITIAPVEADRTFVYAGNSLGLELVITDEGDNMDVTFEVPVGSIHSQPVNCLGAGQTVIASAPLEDGQARVYYCPPFQEGPASATIAITGQPNQAQASLTLEVRRDALRFEYHVDIASYNTTELSARCPDLDPDQPFIPLSVTLVGNDPRTLRSYQVTLRFSLPGGRFLVGEACTLQAGPALTLSMGLGDSVTFLYQATVDQTDVPLDLDMNLTPLWLGSFVEHIPPVVVIRTDESSVNVRNNPDTEVSAVVGTVAANSTVVATLLDRGIPDEEADIEWLRIQLDDGTEGWISREVRAVFNARILGE
jgi:hypothetical protein